MKYSYDSRCEDLARVFLEDAGKQTDENVKELAQAIQDVIESHLSGDSTGKP